MAEITKNFWDFSEPFLGFFLHIASIMMSTHALAHYAMNCTYAERSPGSAA